MTDLSSIQGWLSSVQVTMGDLGSQVQQAAPSGDFAAVFSEAQAVLAGPGGQPGTAPATGGAGGASPLPTSSFLAGLQGGASSTTSSTAVVATAEKYLGVPYLWGGTTPSGFDCSGFTQYVFGQLGVALPRTSEQQATAGVAVPSLADAQPGDLVFYAGSDGTAASPGHVGIYLGNGQMIDAPQTGSTVTIQPVGNPVAIRRVLGTPGAYAGASLAGGGAQAQGAPYLGATSVPVGGVPAGGVPVGGVPAGGSPVGGQPASPSVMVPSSLAPLFTAAAARYGVPVTLLAAVAQVESGYNPGAVSTAGAEGLMQILPTTAAGLQIDPFDPAQAINGAAQLLSGYLTQYHSTPLALAAYNAGPDAVAQYGGVPPYAETQAYVQNVMQIAGGAS